MSQVRPTDDPSVVQTPKKAGKSSGSRLRLLALIGFFVLLIGSAGFMQWKKNHDEQVTDQVRAELVKRGFNADYSQADPQEAAFPLFQSGTAAKTIRIGCGKTPIKDEDLKEVANINMDMDLVFDKCPITDAGLAYLKGKRNIRWLKLQGTKITNEGLKDLQGMNLEILDISNTKIDDDGLATLAQFDFPHLKDLSVARTKVTDNGIQPLSRYRSLEWLTLSQTKVTPKGQQHLKAKLPDVSLVSD